MAEVETTHQRNGSITAALTTGIIGTGLGLINNNGGLGGILGGNNANYATKDDLASAIALSAKDSEIALLKANAESEKKMIDVYERVMARVNADKTEQTAINTQQAVYNSANNAAVSVLNTQVAQLMGLCTLKVNADNVCPKPMPQYNSWTAPN